MSEGTRPPTAPARSAPGAFGRGVRKGRSRSGRVRRRTITPIETITNAISVPMLTSSPSTPIGVKPAARRPSAPRRQAACTAEPDHHGGDKHVQNRADNERPDDPDRHVALRVARFLRGGARRAVRGPGTDRCGARRTTALDPPAEVTGAARAAGHARVVPDLQTLILPRALSRQPLSVISSIAKSILSMSKEASCGVQ